MCNLLVFTIVGEKKSLAGAETLSRMTQSLEVSNVLLHEKITFIALLLNVVDYCMW